MKVLELIHCNGHKWIICVNLKVNNFLLGQENGFNNFHAFLVWRIVVQKTSAGSRGNDQNVEKIVFSPLYIKLEFIKRFIKVLYKENGCFRYYLESFSGHSEEKLKAGIFDGKWIMKNSWLSQWLFWRELHGTCLSLSLITFLARESL